MKIICFPALVLLVLNLSAKAAERPNILWLHAEDMSPLLGCYGTNISTPVLDKLAKEGVLFERCYTPTPVCSTCRSGLMLGAYPTTYGAHQHRSRTGALPEGVRTFPELLRVDLNLKIAILQIGREAKVVINTQAGQLTGGRFALREDFLLESVDGHGGKWG